MTTAIVPNQGIGRGRGRAARGSKGNRGGKGGKGGRGQKGAPGETRYAVGSESHRVSYCDQNGVTHGDDSLDLYLKVDRRYALRSDLVAEFGPEDEWCFPPMASNMFGKGRFILCNNKAHDPKHATATSSAHQYPPDYRSRFRRHFR